MLPAVLMAAIKKAPDGKRVEALALDYKLKPEIVLDALAKAKEKGTIYENPAGCWRSC